MKRHARWLMLAAVAAALPIGGCHIASVLMDAFRPPQKVHAVYEPPEDKVFCVLVDDVQKPLADQAIKRYLTGKINEKLLARKVAADAVPYDDLLGYATAHPNYNRMSLLEIGRAMDADIVMQVVVKEFTLRDTDTEMLWRGHLVTQVRLFDIHEMRRIFPTETELYDVAAVTLPTVAEDSPSYGTTVAEKLAEKMSERIVDLFDDHYVDPAEAEKREQPTIEGWES